MTTILLVEDDPLIHKLILNHLENQNYHVLSAYDGGVAAEYIEQATLDLIILDIMLPVHTGYELMPFITDHNIPVLMLSALDQVDHKLKGFHLGVDDYLAKPFDISELLMRIQVILRRNNKSKQLIEYKQLKIDENQRSVSLSGDVINMTPKEYEILLYFMNHIGIALERNRLMDQFWGESANPDSRTLDLHIQRIRKKAQLDQELRTIYKFGFVLDKAS